MRALLVALFLVSTFAGCLSEEESVPDSFDEQPAQASKCDGVWWRITDAGGNSLAGANGMGGGDLEGAFELYINMTATVSVFSGNQLSTYGFEIYNLEDPDTIVASNSGDPANTSPSVEVSQDFVAGSYGVTVSPQRSAGGIWDLQIGDELPLDC